MQSTNPSNANNALANRPSLYAITAAHISVDMQTGSLAVLLPYLLSSLNLNYSSATAIITANNIIIALMQPLIGAWGDRRPAKHLVWTGTLLTGLAMVAVLWLPNYWLVVLAVLFSGLGSAMFHPEALARARAVTHDQPATGVSVFFSGGNIGFALGPILAIWLTQQYGKAGALAMFIPTLLGLVALASQWPVIAASRNAGQNQTRSASSIAWALVTFLIVLVAVRGTITAGLQAFIPLYFHENGQLRPEAAAALVTVISLSGVVGTLAGGNLADRFGRRFVMAISLLISLLSLYGFMHTDGWVRVVLASIAGMTISAAWPVIVVMIQEAMPGNLGLAGGLSLGTTYAAQGLGVAALGLYADVQGVASTMTLITWIPLLALALTFFVPEKKFTT